MPRYELTDETSAKFWEIQVKGSEIVVTYGRIGSKGQTRAKDHGSPALAKKAATKLTNAKVKKGYAKKVAQKRAARPKAPRTGKKGATGRNKTPAAKGATPDSDQQIVDKIASAFAEARPKSRTTKSPYLGRPIGSLWKFQWSQSGPMHQHNLDMRKRTL
ncbi:MAG: WGR domain-containing protein [Myxococcales bacterium]|nr:WGR domain-containing protein [Myxococcales bacterium]